MSRHIALCFDGTNDKYAAHGNTNVLKLYQMLDRDETRQLLYYQPGIGTMAPRNVVPWQATNTVDQKGAWS
jgi:uncharacterized protein (DUF2235 family)